MWGISPQPMPHMADEGWVRPPYSCSQGWLTYAIANRVSSAMLPRRVAGSAFPSVVCMGQLLCQLEAVRARKEGIFSSCLHHTADKEAVLAMLLLYPQDYLTYAPDYRVNSTELHMQGRGPVLLMAAADEGLNQFSHLLQVLRSEGRRPSFPHPRFHRKEGLVLLFYP